LFIELKKDLYTGCNERKSNLLQLWAGLDFATHHHPNLFSSKKETTMVHILQVKKFPQMGQLVANNNNISRLFDNVQRNLFTKQGNRLDFVYRH